MSDWDFWATLRTESPRYTEWQQVFGSSTSGADAIRVPITSPIAERVRLPIGVRTVLFLAADQLTPSQKAQLIVFLAFKFHRDPQEVQDEIEREPRKSVPLLDEDLSVIVLHPQRWF